jgi:hypothetical protein
MSNDHRPTHPPADRRGVDEAPPRFEIRVRGRLAPRWSAWLDGFAVTTHDDGTTALSGPVVDQAALHGLLQKLRDLGIPLISLAELRPDDAPEHPHTEFHHHHTPGATS